MVIAVAMGFAPSTGHRITVEGVAVDPDRGVVVTVGLVVAEGVQGMMVTYPLDVVAVPRVRGTIVFRDHLRSGEGGNDRDD
jgi:hypothetical protein